MTYHSNQPMSQPLPYWKPTPAFKVKTDDILLYENNAWLVTDIAEYPTAWPLVPLVIYIKRAEVGHWLKFGPSYMLRRTELMILEY